MLGLCVLVSTWLCRYHSRGAWEDIAPARFLDARCQSIRNLQKKSFTAMILVMETIDCIRLL